MKLNIDLVEREENSVSIDMFGANNIFRYNTISGGNGTFDEAVDLLGVANIRYPGGTVTELYFDVNNPDAKPEEWSSKSKFLPLTEFLEYSISTNKGACIVLPTAPFYSGTMDHVTNTPRELSQQYLVDTLRYVELLITKGDTGVGSLPDARIVSIEIGNEYWGIGLSELEYGKVVNALASGIQNIFDEVLGPDAQHPDILVQMADPWGPQYASRDGKYYGMSWSQKLQVANNEIVSQITNPASRAAIDGLVEHYYMKHLGDEFIQTGSVFTNFIGTDFAIWSRNGFANRDLHITEWNNGNNNSAQYGLRGASIVIAQMEAMMGLGVDAAYAWPVQSGTTDLAGNIGTAPILTPTGAAFKLMSESLVGKSYIPTNISGGEIEVDAYFSDGELVLFVSSRSDTAERVDFNFLDSVYSYLNMTGVKISVAEGVPVSQESAIAVMTNYGIQDLTSSGSLKFDLKPFEVMQVTITGILTHSEAGAGIGKTIEGSAIRDVLQGSNKSEVIHGLNGNDMIFGGMGTDTLFGGSGYDEIIGEIGNDILHGENGFDLLIGGAGNDTIFGGNGKDTLTGGTGGDHLYGGPDADVFKFNSTTDLSTSLSNTDIIFDFEKGVDKIDLSAIDASRLIRGNNAFTFIVSDPFGGSSGMEIDCEVFDLPGTQDDYTAIFISNESHVRQGMMVVMGLHNFTVGDFIL
jgi:Ca2+-binding RTX toxin-like protein